MKVVSGNPAHLLIILLGIICFVTNSASAAKRVALVIGNSDYKNASSLPNPTNDADAITKILRDIGFEVNKIKDVGYTQMRLALRQFSSKAARADIALIFYAGHGMEVDKHNYLLPSDVTLASDRDIDFEAVPLDLVTQAAGGAKVLSLVLLDACRNNPFAASMKRTIATRSIGRGLAKVEPTVGTLVSFAAKEGTVAEDGKGNNSPYTSALIKHLREPGLEINLLFRRVRDAVLEETHGSQEPFTYSSLPGKQLFLIEPQVSKIEVAKKKPGITSPEAKSVIPSQSNAERFYNQIKDSRNLELLELFTKKYSNSFYAAIVNARIKELKTRQIKIEADKQKAISQPGINKRLAKLKEAEQKWKLLKGSNDITALKQFSKIYSDTAFAAVAESQIALLGQIALLEDSRKQVKKEASINEDGRAALRYNEIYASNDKSELRAFINKFPNTSYAHYAKNRLKRLELQRKQIVKRDEAFEKWSEISLSKNRGELTRFMNRYRNTRYARLAEDRINSLEPQRKRIIKKDEAFIRWSEISLSKNRGELTRFMNKYRNTRYARLAEDRIKRLGLIRKRAFKKVGNRNSVKIASSKRWVARHRDIDNGITCSAVTGPSSGRANAVTAVFVSNWLFNSNRDHIFHTPSARFVDKRLPISKFTWEIAGAVFEFDIQKNFAFAKNKSQSSEIVEAMKTKRQIITRTTAKNGNVYVDKFSLNGVTAMLKRIDKACPKY